MKLRDWRKQQEPKLSQTDVANKLSELTGSTITHDLVSRLENGQLPTRDQGAAIAKMTEGAVGPADFYEAA